MACNNIASTTAENKILYVTYLTKNLVSDLLPDFPPSLISEKQNINIY